MSHTARNFTIINNKRYAHLWITGTTVWESGRGIGERQPIFLLLNTLWVSFLFFYTKDKRIWSQQGKRNSTTAHWILSINGAREKRSESFFFFQPSKWPHCTFKSSALKVEAHLVCNYILAFDAAQPSFSLATREQSANATTTGRSSQSFTFKEVMILHCFCMPRCMMVFLMTMAMLTRSRSVCGGDGFHK